MESALIRSTSPTPYTMIPMFWFFYVNYDDSGIRGKLVNDKVQPFSQVYYGSDCLSFVEDALDI